MANNQGNLSIFPELVIGPDDVSESWNRFREEFDIMVEWKTLDVGTKTVTQGTGSQAREVEVDRFTDQMKLLALVRRADRSSLLWGLDPQLQIPPIMMR